MNLIGKRMSLTACAALDGQGNPEPTQLLVEGMLMKLLARSPDGTLMCCANETHLKFVDLRFLKLYGTNTPGAIMAASFHPQKYELFLKIDSRTLVALSPVRPQLQRAPRGPMACVPDDRACPADF